MSGAETVAVMTTINDPDSLNVYAENAVRYDRLSTSRIIVIGDKKTPLGIASRIREINHRFGDFIDWWDFDRQLEWLEATRPNLIPMIPPNSDNRRNIGYLVALSEDARVVISIDDDNYPVEGSDYFGEHAVCGRRFVGTLVEEAGWFNIMDALEVKPDVRIWPRGFPYRMRTSSIGADEGEETDALVGINAGLWLGDPDVDAVTRIALRPMAQSQQRDDILLRRTYSPVNSQNSSISADLLPAYYYYRMDENLHGWPVNRFGDIWQGFVVQSVAYHLGYAMKVGKPLVHQARNEHDLLIDLKQELPGILVSEWLSELITSFAFSESTAGNCCLELHDHILKEVERRDGVSADVVEYFGEINRTVEEWVSTCQDLSFNQ